MNIWMLLELLKFIDDINDIIINNQSVFYTGIYFTLIENYKVSAVKVINKSSCRVDTE